MDVNGIGYTDCILEQYLKEMWFSFETRHKGFNTIVAIIVSATVNCGKKAQHNERGLDETHFFFYPRDRCR